jgi:hypothetical protein
VGDILSTGYHAVEQGQVKPGDTVVVFGAGPVGILAMLSARLFSPLARDYGDMASCLIAGIIETMSLGRKGVYIKVLNDNLFDELRE